ncbi:MAG: GntR family transcriptional regulator [Eubacteriaceae bacterium]|nr:GntR family transcriptional regulator [Eubacteriaceae bacterium]
MITHRSVSLADQVFDYLENDILTGVYARGEILTEGKISEKLGVSRTPVREALRRLEQEHLIEESGKGMLVVGISPEDADNIYEIRERIEGLAAALATRNASNEELVRLGEILDLQEFYLGRDDAEKIKSMDNDFHREVYRLSGSAVYYDTLMPLHKKIQKFRKSAIQDPDRAASSVAEHRRILQTMTARDEAAAEEAMVDHIRMAREHLRKQLGPSEDAK